MIFDYETGEQRFLELSSSFCHSPQQRKMKWSPCSQYLFLLSSENTLLILSKTCQEIGTISEFSSQSKNPILDFFPFESQRKTASTVEFYFHVIFRNGDCVTLKVFQDLALDNFQTEVRSLLVMPIWFRRLIIFRFFAN